MIDFWAEWLFNFENLIISPYTVRFKITFGPACQRIKIMCFLCIVLLLGRGLRRPRLVIHVAEKLFDKKKLSWPWKTSTAFPTLTRLTLFVESNCAVFIIPTHQSSLWHAWHHAHHCHDCLQSPESRALCRIWECHSVVNGPVSSDTVIYLF